MSHHKLIGILLGVLMVAQLVTVQSDFVGIDTAEKLLDEFASPTVIGVGVFIVAGLAASVMAVFRIGGWRIGVLAAVGLYIWFVWYPDFLHLVVKYRVWTVVSGIYDQARATGTIGWVLIHKVLYPAGFLAILLGTLWDLKNAGNSK